MSTGIGQWFLIVNTSHQYPQYWPQYQPIYTVNIHIRYLKTRYDIADIIWDSTNIWNHGSYRLRMVFFSSFFGFSERRLRSIEFFRKVAINWCLSHSFSRVLLFAKIIVLILDLKPINRVSPHMQSLSL